MTGRGGIHSDEPAGAATSERSRGGVTPVPGFPADANTATRGGAVGTSRRTVSSPRSIRNRVALLDTLTRGRGAAALERASLPWRSLTRELPGGNERIRNTLAGFSFRMTFARHSHPVSGSATSLSEDGEKLDEPCRKRSVGGGGRSGGWGGGGGGVPPSWGSPCLPVRGGGGWGGGGGGVCVGGGGGLFSLWWGGGGGGGGFLVFFGGSGHQGTSAVNIGTAWVRNLLSIRASMRAAWIAKGLDRFARDR